MEALHQSSLDGKDCGVEDHQPARLDSDAIERTNRLQLRTCPLPLLLRSLPLNNTVSRLTANFEETLNLVGFQLFQQIVFHVQES